VTRVYWNQKGDRVDDFSNKRTAGVFSDCQATESALIQLQSSGFGVRVATDQQCTLRLSLPKKKVD
jgi:hypothetical protein